MGEDKDSSGRSIPHAIPRDMDAAGNPVSEEATGTSNGVNNDCHFQDIRICEAIRTKFKFIIHLQNSNFQASDDFKSDDSKTFLRQDITKRFPDS